MLWTFSQPVPVFSVFFSQPKKRKNSQLLATLPRLRFLSQVCEETGLRVFFYPKLDCGIC